MRVFGARVAIATLFALSAGGGRAAAQTGLIAEAAIGYAYVSDDESSIEFPFGWMASVGGFVASWFAIVGEVTGSYRTLTVGITDVTLRQHAFTAGPRVTATAGTPIAPYGQILFGVAHGVANLSTIGSDLSLRGTSFIYQPGAGVDLNLSRNRAVRVEADFRQMRDEGRTPSQWRFASVFVFRN